MPSNIPYSVINVSFLSAARSSSILYIESISDSVDPKQASWSRYPEGRTLYMLEMGKTVVLDASAQSG
jgi:hypothetical protein